MHRFSILFVAFLCGCASGTASSGDLLTQPRIRTVLAGSVTSENPGGATETIRYIEDPVIIRETVPGTVLETWNLLLDSWSAQGLVPDQIDQVTRTLSVSRFDLQREWDGVPISTYLDCGLSSTGRPLADDTPIRASIIARIGEAGTASAQISMRFEGVAYPSNAAAGLAQDCYTTGELEHALMARVHDALTASPDEESPGGEPSFSQGPLFSPVAGVSGEMVAPGTAFPVEPGERIRIQVTTTERYTGTFLSFRNDSILMRRTRVSTLPLSSVRTLEVQHNHTGVIWGGAAIGAGLGVAIAVGTDIGITGRHEVQGEILNPGLGLVVGGLTGAFLASKLFGSRWVEVPLELEAGPGLDAPGVGFRLRFPAPPGR
jgi:hypothetical protein